MPRRAAAGLRAGLPGVAAAASDVARTGSMSSAKEGEHLVVKLAGA